MLTYTMSKGLLITEGQKTTIMFALSEQFLPVGGYPDLTVRLDNDHLVVVQGMGASRQNAESTKERPLTIRGNTQLAQVTVIDIGVPDNINL